MSESKGGACNGLCALGLALIMIFCSLPGWVGIMLVAVAYHQAVCH